MKKIIFKTAVLIGTVLMLFSTAANAQSETETAEIIQPDVYTPFDDAEKPPGYIVSQNESKELSIIVYPNPANGKITISDYNAEPQDEVLVFSITGKLVLKQFFENKRVMEIDLSHLPKGYYLIKAKMDVVKIQLV